VCSRKPLSKSPIFYLITLIRNCFFISLCFFASHGLAAELNWDTGVWGDTFAPDFDGDGYEDVIDAFHTDPTEWADLDLDSIGNNADWDDDGDGVVDWVDQDSLNAGNTTEIDLPMESGYSGSALSTKRH